MAVDRHWGGSIQNQEDPNGWDLKMPPNPTELLSEFS
jgi:hypothetical protein